MVAEGWEDGSVREEGEELLHGVTKRFGVGGLGLVPYVVGRQVSRPQDVVYVLESSSTILFFYRLWGVYL